MFNLEVAQDVSYPEFFEQTPVRNEYLGLFKVKKSDIHFIKYNEILLFINKFFSNGLHIKNNMSKDKIDDHNYLVKWQENFEIYSKYVWLTKEYFAAGKKFKNYMGIHWNPILKKYIIHPGGSRQVIHKYFGPEEYTFLGFNTGGIEVEWIEKFTCEQELFNRFPNACIDFCEDHGTLIPHPHFNNIDVFDSVTANIPRIIDFYHKHKIIANFNVTEFGLNQVDNYSNTVRVTIDKNDLDHKIKAFMLLPNFDYFEGYGVKIETA